MAVCTWPVDYSSCSTAFEGVSVEERAKVEAMATEYLSAWAPGFGLCDTVVRPCRTDCDASTQQSTFGGHPPLWRPVLVGGRWYNLTCSTCLSDVCGCDLGAKGLTLPGPVHEVTDVTIDGVPLPSDAYVVYDHNTLVRLDGDVWPACQDLAADATEAGTFEVSYQRGRPVPVAGQVAAGVLAEQFYLALCGSSKCQLPQRVQTITRQGVTVAMLDSFEDVGKGHTGIWLIDSWLASVTSPPRPSTVLSPDYSPRRTRSRTWPAT